MRRDLSHLPQPKRQEISRIVEAIRAEPGIDPEMMILFGSYARGDWVEDWYVEGHTTYSYISDYDILVVVKNLRHGTMSGRWNDIERKLARLVPLHGPSVNLIIHDIDYLNARLGEGRYFFRDISKEGVLLYDSGAFALAEPKVLANEELKRLAEEDFGQWFPMAEFSCKKSGYDVAEEQFKEAAFDLHQATERFYTAFLLVHTGYKPKFHDIAKLGKLAAAEKNEMMRVFPLGTDDEKRRFELLRRAYVDARYSRTYDITREDLEYLQGRVRALRDAVESFCRARIAELGRQG